ncbi:MAG: UDP-N-acetylmuramoyl-L-alanine--D-glutamate ligase [Candidatus Pacebacteria bacterium]|nr:UDP-N-acetylmuramoyl-L-alanine--D-glutamate ligase [Candidatus Paceibacterota bacterium]MDD5356525.1 UDP-N-acetylmuramoyl-L-alanine--D-glutamate ligase [Candidatus Paceibacterota bacterium]
MQIGGYFRGKKITIMGLGLLGRGLGDVRFLAEEGAELIVTDLKTKEQLADSLKALEAFPNITYVLGEHRLKDFQGRDMVVKAAGVPLDSPYVAEARKNGIPIEMDASLFAKLTIGVTIIGITGTRGKTTTTSLVYEIARRHFDGTSTKVFLGGNIRGTATLPLIREVKAGDVMVLELDSWQLQGFGEAKISPHISIFTNFLDDHLNYYKGDRDLYFQDKAQIFLNQTKGDVCITSDDLAIEIVKRFGKDMKGALVKAKPSKIPLDWKFHLRGEHNRENIALAIEAGKALGATMEEIREAIERFRGVPGRLEFLVNYKGVYFYNDTCATTPDATLAGLKTLAFQRNVVLIMGGADKGLNMDKLIHALPEYTKEVILLMGTNTTGSERIKDVVLKFPSIKATLATSLEGALGQALLTAEKGDVVLFSPAFASFGMFKNEYDRGDKFNEAVKNLK